MSVPPPPPPLPNSPTGEEQENEEQGAEESLQEDALKDQEEYVPQSPSEDEPPPLPPSPSSPSKSTLNETAETVEQLAKKLQEHKDQLSQVEQMLLENPDDETLLKLKADLTQVVSLTEDLTRGGQGGGDEGEYEEDEAKEGEEPENSIKEHKYEDAKSVVATEGESTTVPVSTVDDEGVPIPNEKKWTVGERCQALWEDGKWYNARIDGITAAENFSISYLDYGNTSDVPESSLKAYIPAPEGQLSQGVKVKAIYQEDGLFYDAVIDSVLEPGLYAVKYLKWKKKQRFEVPIYDIVLREYGQKIDTTPDELRIPETLKYKPSDSEAQKLKKRKQIKRLKSTFRTKKREEEGLKRQKSWQNFVKGHRKKQKTKPKDSIFASPAEVDGRVGVINSGRTMTKYQEPSKHLFGAKSGSAGGTLTAPPTQAMEEE